MSVERSIGSRRLALAIPGYSNEKNLRKRLQKFERDPTVGSKVMDLFMRYFARVCGTTRTDIVGVE